MLYPTNVYVYAYPIRSYPFFHSLYVQKGFYTCINMSIIAIVILCLKTFINYGVLYDLLLSCNLTVNINLLCKLHDLISSEEHTSYIKNLFQVTFETTRFLNFRYQKEMKSLLSNWAVTLWNGISDIENV